jgi:hypothetical protein
MKYALAVVAFFASATTLSAQTAIQLKVHESLVLQINGSTAAYAIDESIATANGRDGLVTVFGRSAGSTRVMVVAFGRTVAYDVVVIAPASAAGGTPMTAEAPRRAVTEARYLSTTGQVQTSIDAVANNAQAHAVILHDQQKTSVPSASYRITTPHAEVTLLDKHVDETPLTTAPSAVRGVHFFNDAWRVHAGVTSATFYDSFVLPTSHRQFVFGASRVWHLSPSWSVMPNLYVAGKKPIASLLAEYADGDRLRARGEIGFSNHSPGGAFQLAANGARSHLRADFRWQPRDFATLGVNDVRGFSGDVSASQSFKKLDVDATASAAHTILPSFNERSVTSTLDLRYHASKAITLLGGASYGAFNLHEKIRNFTVPVGVAANAGGAGISAVYRLGDNNGYRVSGSYSRSSFHGNVFVDQQNHTPTIALFTHEYPELANELLRAGISATSVADIARLVREGATLAALGITNVPQIELALKRRQTGADIAWRELRLRAIRNDVETVSRRTSTTFTTLTWTHRILGSTDLEASYGFWVTDHVRQPAYEIALRHRFDSLPSFGSGAINGNVYRDDDGNSRVPLAGVEVRLDESRSTRSDADGRYRFGNVNGSSHQVSAQLPSNDAYFTTPSHATASRGDAVDFGVAFSPARLRVTVVDDAGRAISGVNVTLTGARRFSATSATDGGADFIAQPGTWRASIADETLASGYTVDGDPEHVITLQRAHTETLKFALRASRTVSGRISGVRDCTEIEIAPLGRRAMTDETGHFAIRSLPAGAITLRARVSGAVSQSIVVPVEPSVIDDVVLKSSVAGGE